jgi:hypothetical protein
MEGRCNHVDEERTTKKTVTCDEWKYELTLIRL